MCRRRSASAISSTWGDALTTCETSTVGGLTWRMPTIRELESIVDDRLSMPVVDYVYFTDSIADLNRPYWSATTIFSNSAKAWGKYFFNGEIHSTTTYAGKGFPGAVSCVR
ncbi:MAG: Lcl C-terminal domain-containing protein [Nitrospirota bacterium]